MLVSRRDHLLIRSHELADVLRCGLEIGQVAFDGASGSEKEKGHARNGLSRMRSPPLQHRRPPVGGSPPGSIAFGIRGRRRVVVDGDKALWGSVEEVDIALEEAVADGNTLPRLRTGRPQPTRCLLRSRGRSSGARRGPPDPPRSRNGPSATAEGRDHAAASEGLRTVRSQHRGHSRQSGP